MLNAMAEFEKTGEFGLIDRIRYQFKTPEGYLGIGDDCAVIPESDGYETLVSTDMLVEDSHFILDRITPYQLGWKSAAVNFSDIAAMGGEPVGSFLSLALPESLASSREWIDEFFRGYKDISERYGFALLGGDTTSSKDKLCINVTVLGRSRRGESKRRSTAVAGDLICVTGTLGDSGAGLDITLSGRDLNLLSDDEIYLLERHCMPTPRIEEGIALARQEKVHAMMDISDGIASDLLHILEESVGLSGASIYLDKLPISQQLKQYCYLNNKNVKALSTGAGEDYELLFTIDQHAEQDLDVPHTVIGRIIGPDDSFDTSCDVTNVNGIVYLENGKITDEKFIGFSHF